MIFFKKNENNAASLPPVPFFNYSKKSRESVCRRLLVAAKPVADHVDIDRLLALLDSGGYAKVCEEPSLLCCRPISNR